MAAKEVTNKEDVPARRCSFKCMAIRQSELVMDTTAEIPRGEYPRPQFRRDDWLCLNGWWQFAEDGTDDGYDRGFLSRNFEQQILVPFAPESPLSGIGKADFMEAVWYRRQLQIPNDWSGSRLLLNFQAVDYDTTAWINGVEVGRHRGGFSSFSFEVTDYIRPGESVELTVRARDSHREPKARGKQSQLFANYECVYTRTTGIWQTVWLEPVPETFLRRPRITPDVANSMFRIVAPIGPGTRADQARQHRPLKLRATLRDEHGVVCTAQAAIVDFSPQLNLSIPGERRRLWSPDDPHLYDLTLELLDSAETVIDQLESYAGLRSVTIDGAAVKVNGKTIFQRLVLDQGYYPDGILTAPTDEALRRDIELAIEAGFNGARLHEKVFEERFLYYADKMGYLCWAEFADWGCGGYGPEHDHQKPPAAYITEWLEVILRDYSHPSIIGWCPLNETGQLIQDNITVLDEVTHGMFLATKALDLSRPVIDTSGYSHRVPETDIYDCHDYEQEPTAFAQNHRGTGSGMSYCNTGTNSQPFSIARRGQPFFVSEFGGIWWNPEVEEDEASWGYGTRPRTIEDFYKRFESLCGVLLENPHMFGYCYTQLTDVYQEQNGIYTFDRRHKFDLERIRRAQMKRAAIEDAER